MQFCGLAQPATFALSLSRRLAELLGFDSVETIKKIAAGNHGIDEGQD